MGAGKEEKEQEGLKRGEGGGLTEWEMVFG